MVAPSRPLAAPWDSQNPGCLTRFSLPIEPVKPFSQVGPAGVPMDSPSVLELIGELRVRPGALAIFAIPGIPWLTRHLIPAPQGPPLGSHLDHASKRFLEGGARRFPLAIQVWR